MSNISAITDNILNGCSVRESLNPNKTYTDKEKEELFKRMQDYNEKHHNYRSPYGYQAYTDETYAEWDSFLKKVADEENE